MFFFEEFDNNNKSLQQDSKVIKRQKIKFEAKRWKNELFSSSVKSFWDEYLEDDPSLILKWIEPLKQQSKDESLNSNLFFEDIDEDLELIMKG